MSEIRACLFDLDGVIVDTAKYHYLAWKRLANELGFDFTEEDNERLKGVSRMKSLEILLEIGGIEMTEEDKLSNATRKNEWYREFILKMPKEEIFEGVKEFLQSLRDNDIKIALGSASKNAMTILERLEITDMFDGIVDGTNVSKAKPDPEVFLRGAEILGVEPKDCVVFEDAEAGVEAAKRAEMICVGIGSEAVLSKADIVIEGLKDMNLEKLNSLK